MAFHPPRSRSLAGLTALALAPLVLSACSAGSLGSSDDDGGGGTSITFLVDNAPQTIATAEALADDFNAQQSEVRVEVETRPQGTEGDNLVKTRLQTGSMNDVFAYNSGSLFQQLAPQSSLTPLTGEAFLDGVDDSFTPQVSAGDEVYGVPLGTAFGGGVLYNRKVYEQLGLQVPQTWADFIANSEKIKAAGIAPVVQTYGETWTSQLLVLGDFHNVAAANPSFAEEYTAGRAKYATDAAAIKGFQHTQEIHDKALTNADYASAKVEDGIRMLAAGEGAQYPLLSTNVATILSVAPDKIGDIGFFALPGDDAATNGLTAWFPGGVYVPKSTTGEELEAAKKFLDYLVTPESCDIQSEKSVPTGPYLVEGCELPGDVPQITEDVSAYFDSERQSPALEYVSPIKGPALEQILVEVGSGIRSAEDAAALYDQDVEKQAQQLGLEGW
ncbi:ABC transporter substrate-binding protein [Kineococcus glutinatus]|uniref:Carbohydrate ABC transporter substrate-binding protein (CUT1 family) n=1 Tax=Kineococcus glutinatus TaxID=1070872 RepID=A0ABP9HUS3_9ACTN